MKLEEIKKLDPINRLAYCIIERESIRLKKETGEPRPWTQDEIFRSYRFTNVRRMDDKVSLWLLNNWYKPYFNHPNMLVACSYARFFNLPETLGPITQLVFWGQNREHSFQEYLPENIKAHLRLKSKAGVKLFNSAYMVRGNDGVDKVATVVDYTIQPLVDKPPKIDTSSMEKSWLALRGYYGFGSFMAGQVCADMRHAVEGTWADKDTWAPLGPGSQRGMNRLLGRPINKTIKQGDFVRELRELTEKLKKLVPESIMDRLEAIDIQNILCEYFKYTKALLGEGRLKQRYPGNA